jgi:hypothetical protein
MPTKRIPRVLAIASGDTVAIVHYVDIRHLRRHYGPAVASEVVRQLVSVRLQAQERSDRRRTR